MWVTVLSWQSASPHVSQASVMELDLWRWLSWRSCPPSHTAVLVETWTGWNPKPAFSSFPRSDVVGEAQSAQLLLINNS